MPRRDRASRSSNSMTTTRQRIGRRAQQGVTMVGLLFWAGTVGFLAYLAVRTLPTVNEFTTIQSTIDKIAAAPPPTVGAIRAAFDRQKEIEYSIQSISGKDLDVTKENDKVVISFAYDKEVPLFGPVYLLLKYKGRSN
jgi:FAD/FMN-containing dehydrogenase